MIVRKEHYASATLGTLLYWWAFKQDWMTGANIVCGIFLPICMSWVMSLRIRREDS
jgi:hypothetical protein